jgi:hypothetical protein
MYIARGKTFNLWMLVLTTSLTQSQPLLEWQQMKHKGEKFVNVHGNLS